MKKPIVVVLVSLLFVLMVSTGCLNNNNNLKKNGSDKKITIPHSGTYPSIQSAIDHATKGDTILVPNGTYYETVIIDKEIRLLGEDRNNTLIKNDLKNNQDGAVIKVYADNCTISNLTLVNCYNCEIGILLNGSGTKIVNNTINGFDQGIYVAEKILNKKELEEYIEKTGSKFYSRSYFKGNEFLNNKKGLFFINAYESAVSQNVFKDNEYCVFILSSGNNSFMQNILVRNYCGFRLKLSSSNLFVKNNVTKNQYGIKICCGSTDNSIYGNFFVDNYKFNAVDYITNRWDNGTVGNYWGDYNGTDVDGDGIGDKEYKIPMGENQDRFPLIKPNKSFFKI